MKRCESSSTENQPINVVGKTVIVTGASSGIGESISRQFANHGLNVVLLARRKEKLDQIVSEITQSGGSAFAISCDVTCPDQVSEAFQQASAKFGSIHFLIANAGFVCPPIDITSVNAVPEFEKVINVNLNGVFSTYREGIMALRKTGGGAIILVSSSLAMAPISINIQRVPSVNYFAYCASKAAIDSIGRTAVCLLKENIRVYTLSPCVYTSEMTEGLATANNTTLEKMAFKNPVYPSKPGDTKDIGPIMLAMLDNSTLYTPGSVVGCDHDVTFNGEYLYKTVWDSPDHYEPVPKEYHRDFQGKPKE
jgi:NAD(P)-dependent dehydrogenase (short-subunit alcohol dehydrogenase family)